mmetsp:Transcript_35462/g.85811  ORF Transcript_35462/g.85811 Transcript_35462/m.85811 type:complete len:355 (-) Transcript_35462:70-1134(-)
MLRNDHCYCDVLLRRKHEMIMTMMIVNIITTSTTTCLRIINKKNFNDGRQRKNEIAGRRGSKNHADDKGRRDGIQSNQTTQALSVESSIIHMPNELRDDDNDDRDLKNIRRKFLQETDSQSSAPPFNNIPTGMNHSLSTNKGPKSEILDTDGLPPGYYRRKSDGLILSYDSVSASERPVAAAAAAGVARVSRAAPKKRHNDRPTSSCLYEEESNSIIDQHVESKPANQQPKIPASRRQQDTRKSNDKPRQSKTRKGKKAERQLNNMSKIDSNNKKIDFGGEYPELSRDGDRIPEVINKHRFVIPSSAISDLSVSSSKHTNGSNISEGKSITSDNMGFLEAALTTIGTGMSVLAG